MKKLFIAVLMVFLMVGWAGAEISRIEDDFDDFVAVSSYISDSEYYAGCWLEYQTEELKYPRKNFSVSPFDGVLVLKYKEAGRIKYRMTIYQDSVYTYFPYTSRGILKVGGQIIQLVRTSWKTTYVSFDASPIMDRLGQEMEIKVELTAADLTLEISDSLTQEWKQLLSTSVDDTELSTLHPMGDALVTDASIFGWARDHSSATTKPEIHFYHGPNALFSKIAEDDTCGKEADWGPDPIPCDNVPPDILKTWSQWLFRVPFNELSSHITTPSLEPITIYAINSKPGGPNAVIFSEKVYLQPDIECAFDWVESVAPEFFPNVFLGQSITTHAEGSNQVRRYSNGAMLAAAPGSGALIYKLGEGYEAVVANLSLLLGDAIEANCQ